jgi:hypothetical protein
MKKTLRHYIAALLFATTAGGAFMAVATPQPTYAACGDRLLTFPAWHRGLTDSKCNIVQPDPAPGGLAKFIWKIGLNIVEAMLQIVGYVTVGYIIFGGFKYMTSSGSSDGMAKARETILNAVIGLILSILSVGIVNLVAGAI